MSAAARKVTALHILPLEGTAEAWPKKLPYIMSKPPTERPGSPKLPVMAMSAVMA